MDSMTSVFLFYYFRELWHRARERERLEAELAGEVSGVFERRRVVAGEHAAKASVDTGPAETEVIAVRRSTER